MLKLNNIRAPFGSNPAPLRKGRGIGSGHGKTAGKGHKGQHARTGAPLGPAFEGGQIPIIRRSPKVGFRSPIKRERLEVNVTELSHFAGRALTIKDLIPKKLSRSVRVKVNVVGTKAPKSFPKSLECHKLAPAAKKILESNGVAVKVLEFTTASPKKKSE